MNHPLFVITGPSAAGKTAIALRLREKFPELQRVITRTTRDVREGEIDGTDYKFVSSAEFREYGEKDRLLEFARVHGKHLYGTTVEDVANPLSIGPTLAVVDPQGVRAYKEKFPEAHCIYVIAPRDQMRNRLLLRDTSPEDFASRMKSVEEEILAVAEPQYELIVNNANGCLERSVTQIRDFIWGFLPKGPGIKKC